MLLFAKSSFPASPSAVAGRLRDAVCGARGLSLAQAREWLVFSGQLEQAVLDAGGPPAVAAVTDSAAGTFLAVRDGQPSGPLQERLLGSLDRVLPHLGSDAVVLRIPEGYAWYALYPDAYARTGQRWAAANPGRTASVTGLRSIGTSLSAVVAEQLRRLGHEVTGRCTLRPEGHPFRRSVQLPDDLRPGDAYIIVDEGPGLSGSSMAGVAAALHARGVPEESIVFFPGHGNGPGSEAGEEQSGWWRAGRCWFTAAEDFRPNPALHSVFAGFAAANAGLQTLAEVKSRRQMQIAEAGFALPPLAVAHGWIGLEDAGQPLSLRDGDAEVFCHLASYIAHAAQPAEDCSASSLERIARAIDAYAHEALPGLTREIIHRLEKRTLAEGLSHLRYGDGRLAPGEWARMDDGRILKRNAMGTDLEHAWNGPQSVLWDVAGAAVEWRMTGGMLTQFLNDLSGRFGIRAGPLGLAFHRAGYCCLQLARAAAGRR